MNLLIYLKNNEEIKSFSEKLDDEIDQNNEENSKTHKESNN